MSEWSLDLMTFLLLTAFLALVVQGIVCLFVTLFWREHERDSFQPARPPNPTPQPPEPQRSAILRPKTAGVRPRGIHPQTCEVFPLEEELRPLIAAHASGAIRIMGKPGSGKTTAIQHLMAVLPDGPWFLDEPDEDIVSYFSSSYLMIYTSRDVSSDRYADLATYVLARWDRDDLIEYLLSVHPSACASVIKRLGATSPLAFEGCPAIWRPILDTMAADPAITDPARALSNYLQWLEPDLEKFQSAGRTCLDRLTASTPKECPGRPAPRNEFESLLGQREVRVLVAAEFLAQELQQPHPPSEDFLGRFYSKDLIEETATILAEDSEAIGHVARLLDRPVKDCALLVSLLHATKFVWPPEFHCDPVLSFAYLDGITWPGVDLAGARLFRSDFRNADLGGAILDAVAGDQANFRGADLSGASMICSEFRSADFREADLSSVKANDSLFEHARFRGGSLPSARLSNCVLTNADFRNANLSNADLTGSFLSVADLQEASLAGADLSAARLHEANLAGADFTGANLSGASLSEVCLREACFDEVDFREACLENCDLEGLRARNVNFECANLKNAALTGSHFTNARFPFACLRGAKLADIDWEGADLRDADLSGATFHMGSSRCGLLFTNIASEGTRTGFYTDEYEEQSFRAPEDIRKANLCGADLRGAAVSKTDFYLVDLRGAKFDPDQAEHFRRCGAIL